MDHKFIFKNKSFCPLPWAGMYVDVTGDVRNCAVSKDSIGNLNDSSIADILHGQTNTVIKDSILNDQKPGSCRACHTIEGNKNSLDIVSNRIHYIKELRSINLDLYADPTNFGLHQVDIRWSNLCNHACVYCNPIYSSKWADELKTNVETITKENKEKLKEYIFSNISKLKNVHLAGGEPLLMKENEEFLKRLLVENPNVSLRVNTNLSKVDTKNLNLITKFKNVAWTVSVDCIGDQFEYVRYGGNWGNFLDNLNIIKTLPHTITFNMVWFVLNSKSIFNTVDYFLKEGFHPNSFVLTPLNEPVCLDTRNLPEHMLKSLANELELRINQHTGYLLEDSYKNLLAHLQVPFNSNWTNTEKELDLLDQRRNLNRQIIFKELYKEINHGN